MGMPFVNHLKAIWIKECLHCFRESRVVPPYIAAFLFCVPLKLHNFTIPYLYGYNHILTDIKRRQIIILFHSWWLRPSLCAQRAGSPPGGCAH